MVEVLELQLTQLGTKHEKHVPFDSGTELNEFTQAEHVGGEVV